MKRIVNGHFADPNSTRDITGISMTDFELLSGELQISKRQAELTKNVDFSKLSDEISDFLDTLENPELFLPPEITIEMMKNNFKDPSFINELKDSGVDRIIFIDSFSSKAKLVGNTWSVLGITPIEYYHLIECIQSNLMSHTALSNNGDNKGATNLATVLSEKMFKSEDIWLLHPLMQDLPKGTDIREAKIEMSNKMMPIMYRWLSEINQQYVEDF